MSTDPRRSDPDAQTPPPGPSSDVGAARTDAGDTADEGLSIGYEAAYPLLQTPLWCEELQAFVPWRDGP